MLYTTAYSSVSPLYFFGGRASNVTKKVVIAWNFARLEIGMAKGEGPVTASQAGTWN